jgi:hypothetical protein
VDEMMDRGIMNITGRPTVQEAWLSLVKTQDVIGIKVYSKPGANSGTRPAVVASAIKGLLKAGIPPNQIIIWDKEYDAMVRAGYYALGRELGVDVAAVSETGYDTEKFYERALIGNLAWGDLEFGRKGDGIGRKSFISRLVSRRITRIISISPMYNHNHIGVTGHLYSLTMGSVDNTIRFETNPTQMAEAIPEIFALDLFADRVALNITDALICQYQGEQSSMLHYSTALCQLRFSRDPVALDVISASEIEAQRKHTAMEWKIPKNELFSNASLLELGISNPKQIRIDYLH